MDIRRDIDQFRIKSILLDKNESELNQIHITDNT